MQGTKFPFTKSDCWKAILRREDLSIIFEETRSFLGKF